MKKLVSLFLAMCIAVLAISAFASEPKAEYEGDGGDWVAVDLDGLLQDMEEILGYVPEFSLSQGGSGEYGTILFMFPTGAVQKMVHYDLEKKVVMMSYHDITMLLYGKELKDYVFPYKDVVIKFSSEPEQGVWLSPLVNGKIVKTGESLFFLIEGKPFVSVRLPRYETMADKNESHYFISGRDIAQAIYDLSMLPN